MFWRNKWQNISIKKKIFLITAGFILTGFFIIYMAMYSFMPVVYQNYKERVLNHNGELFAKSLESASADNISDIISTFAYDNNAIVRVEDNSGNNLFMPMVKPYVGRTNNEKGELISTKQNIYIKSIDKNCTVDIRTMYKPITEATKAIKLFMPFMILIAIIVSLVIAEIYSRFVAKKLNKINGYAEKISGLDFTQKIEVSGSDEIASLYNNLNVMSEKLSSVITELEESNKNLKSDIEKEKLQEKKRREFIATISHELKSPLTVLAGQLEGMRHNIGKYKDRDKYISECSRTVTSMQSLVSETLSISKLESIDKIKIVETSISDMVDEVIYKNSYFIEGRGITLNLDIEDDIFVEVDRELFKRAITNIVVNAFKYTTNNEVISIRLNEKLLEVTNTGANISEEELKNIFDAFYRVDKSRSRKTGGTGLGLYIVKNILEKHKMEYKMTSNKGVVAFKVIF